MDIRIKNLVVNEFLSYPPLPLFTERVVASKRLSAWPPPPLGFDPLIHPAKSGPGGGAMRIGDQVGRWFFDTIAAGICYGARRQVADSRTA